MERLDNILKRFPLRSSSEGAGATDPLPAEEAQAPACAICGDTGWVRASVTPGHPSFGKLLPCQCQEKQSTQERHQRLLRYSNLGAMTRFTFDTLDPKGRGQDPGDQQLFREAMQAAREFANSPKGWLVLAGPSGCGKTHLAAAIALDVIARGQPCLFVGVSDLLDHLRAAFLPGAEMGYDALFEQVRSTPLLVLDDLGGQASTPWAQEKLFQILNARFNSELPTVVTLAVPPTRLEARWRTRLEDAHLSKVLALAQEQPLLHGQLGSPTLEQRRTMTLATFDVRGNSPDPAQRAMLESALKAAQEFARDPEGTWLALTGRPGVGKTHLAVAIYNHQHQQGKRPFFAFVPDLLDYLRFTYQPTSAITYDEFFEQVKATPLLILDDLGSQRSSPWAEEKLYQIIAYRHAARLPTVITMNDTVELSPAIASRINDVSFVLLLEMEARDYRDKGRQPQPPPKARAFRPRGTG